MQSRRALIAGQHAPAALAPDRAAPCKASAEPRRAALTGHDRREQVCTLRQALARYDSAPERSAACAPESAAPRDSLPAAALSLEPRPKARSQQTRHDNAPTFDVRDLLLRG